MGLAEAVVGLGQPVALHVPDHQLEHRLAARAGGPRTGRAPRACSVVERAAEEVLRDHPGAAPGGEEDVGRDERCLDGDVHGGVAHAEHDDRLVAEEAGVLAGVVVRVDLRAGEAVLARERRLGPARVPVVAVGDEQRVVGLA